MVIRNYADVKVHIRTEDILKENIIYCLTFPNGKKYIGQTKQKLQKRLSEHCNTSFNIKSHCFDTKKARAIRKYLTFSVDILYEGKDLDINEIKYIDEYNTFKKGYNSNLGGDGFLGRTLSKEEIDNLIIRNKERLTGKLGKDANRSIPIIQYSKSNEFIREWSCAKEAERELGIKHTAICNNLKGWSKSSGGFIWKYK